MLPWQILPSPVNPGLQEHWYEPTTLTQSPSEEQSCLLDVHSSVSTHELQETEKLDVWAHNINTTAIRGTIHLALDTFVNIYSRLKEDEKNHNIPYFEIDLFHLKFISIVLINYFCQLFQNSTELLAFSTKLILLFVSFLFLPLHDNMRHFSLRFSLRSIIYDLSHHDSNTLISPLGYCCRRKSYNDVSSCRNPGVSILLTNSSIWESTYWTNLNCPLPYGGDILWCRY